MTKARQVIIYAAILSLSVVILVLIYRCGKMPVMIDQTRLFMGTTVQIKVPCGRGMNRKTAEASVVEAFKEIARVESVFSIYDKKSDISRINRMKPGQKLIVTNEVFGLIHTTLKYSEITGGAFDITVKPLVDLWQNFGRLKKLPSEDEVRKSLLCIGYRDIELDEQSRTIAFLKPGMAIDLGGAAKGYASDRAVEVLKQGGIRNAIVNSGGDMHCLGGKLDGRPWTVGIQHPRNKNKVIMELSLEDRAVDTSGDYENFFIIDGKRYSHIIDPLTGNPVNNGVISATVIASDSLEADILATSLCIMGSIGLDMIESLGGASGSIVIEENGKTKILKTAGFEKYHEAK